MKTRRLVIAGTGSGVGKTTVTLGLMAAFKKKGLAVQGYKCGPDYIDPSYHTAVTSRVSRNLDSWMLTEETLLDILTHTSDDADISILEGVMGLFDGRDPTSNEGSTAHISIVTKSPVLLVINCGSMARSAAAIVKGFQTFAKDVHIVGVFANRVGSEGHFQLVKEAIEQECHIPVVGYLKREEKINIPERSLGLIPAIERGELSSFFDELGDKVSKTVDLELLLQLAETETFEKTSDALFPKRVSEKKVTIAIARDSAFNAYYQENFELLESYGATLVYFSPLNDEEVPNEADGLYLGGTLPEEFAETLSQNKRAKRSIRKAISSGLPTFAEGGGFMYLTEKYVTSTGKEFEMVGVIPGKITISTKLKALGYREIIGKKGNFLLPPSELARGHEFHYATFSDGEVNCFAYETKGMRGNNEVGYLTETVVAGFTQFHFASNQETARRFVDFCLLRRSQNE